MREVLGLRAVLFLDEGGIPDALALLLRGTYRDDDGGTTGVTMPIRDAYSIVEWLMQIAHEVRQEDERIQALRRGEVLVSELRDEVLKVRDDAVIVLAVTRCVVRRLDDG